jgi:hypothetical protein
MALRDHLPQLIVFAEVPKGETHSESSAGRFGTRTAPASTLGKQRLGGHKKAK